MLARLLDPQRVQAQGGMSMRRTGSCHRPVSCGRGLRILGLIVGLSINLPASTFRPPWLRLLSISEAMCGDSGGFSNTDESSSVHRRAGGSSVRADHVDGCFVSPFSRAVGRSADVDGVQDRLASHWSLVRAAVRWTLVLAIASALAAAIAAASAPSRTSPSIRDWVCGPRLTQVAAFGIAAVGGCLGGALGLGGGFLVVPAFTSLLGVHPREAIGTSSIVVLAVKCVACPGYVARGVACPRSSCAIAVGALLTARLGAMATTKVDTNVLKQLFGGWLLTVCALLCANETGLMTATTFVPGASTTTALPPLVAVGAGAGFLSGLLGVSGGTALVPSLTLGFGFLQSEAQGCALLAMIPSAIVGSLTHWRAGNVERGLVCPAVLGALAGGVTGSAVAAQLPEHALRLMFAMVVGTVGVKYVAS